MDNSLYGIWCTDILYNISVAQFKVRIWSLWSLQGTRLRASELTRCSCRLAILSVLTMQEEGWHKARSLWIYFEAVFSGDIMNKNSPAGPKRFGNVYKDIHEGRTATLYSRSKSLLNLPKHMAHWPLLQIELRKILFLSTPICSRTSPWD